jgi:hypothetical protein
VSDSTNTSDYISEFEIELDMDENNRTLKELAAPNVTYQPLGIQYPDTDMDFELKSGLIHLLPKFHGLAGEDPHKHLKEFHIVCSTMRPQGIQEEHIKLRAFPFSLADAAKDWLYYLQPGVVTCWNDMKKFFLEKFFPASRTASMRKEICGIRQKSGETLHEYWERLKQLYMCDCKKNGYVRAIHIIKLVTNYLFIIFMKVFFIWTEVWLMLLLVVPW